MPRLNRKPHLEALRTGITPLENRQADNAGNEAASANALSNFLGFH
jgi:hypothetical protein